MSESAHLADDIGVGRQGGYRLYLMQAPARNVCRSDEGMLPALVRTHSLEASRQVVMNDATIVFICRAPRVGQVYPSLLSNLLGSVVFAEAG